MRRLTLSILLWLVAIQQPSAQKTGLFFNESFRPQYHFSIENGILGESGSLLYDDGVYHLFFTYSPSLQPDGAFRWGHAVSNDLIYWTRQTDPQFHGGEQAICPPGPGSALVDYDNQLGFNKNGQPAWIAWFSTAECGVQMAYSNDKGGNWHISSNIAVLPSQGITLQSAPRVFWYPEGAHFVMILHRKPETDERTRGISVYNASNGVDWSFESHIPGFKGTPDLFELYTNNRPEEPKWILMEGDGSYVIGTFNGKLYTPESIRMRNDFGSDYDAPRIFVNLPGEESRTLQLGFLRGSQHDGNGWIGQTTFPSELSLKRFHNGVFLIRQPLSEIKKIQGKGQRWESVNLIPGINKNLIKKVKGDRVHIKGEFDLKTCDSFGFMLRMGKKSGGTELIYNVRRQTLSILGQTIPLEPVDNKIYLEILLDRSSLEVYANNGRAVLSATFFPAPDAINYLLYNTGGELMVDKLEIHEIKQIWRE